MVKKFLAAVAFVALSAVAQAQSPIFFFDSVYAKGKINGSGSPVTPAAGQMVWVLNSAGRFTKTNIGSVGDCWKVTGASTLGWGSCGGGGGGSSPLTTKGDLWGFDSADARVPIGTNGQILTADSAQTLGLKWSSTFSGNSATATALAANGSNCSSGSFPLGVDASGSAEGCTVALTSPLTTKGDLWGFSTVDARVPVGSNGTILNADSGNALGVAYSSRNLDANTHKIINLTDPSHGSQDAATAAWVENLDVSTFIPAALSALSLSNGANNDVLPALNFADRLISGVSANFSVTGFASSGVSDGTRFTLFYAGTDTFTVAHQNAGSVSTNRIICPGNVDLVLPGPSTLTVTWDNSTSRWRVASYGVAKPTTAQLVPTSPSDATQFLNGAATPAFANVKDSDLSTSNVTTNNSSSTKHGFSPVSPADATQFLNGAATPAYAAVKDSDLSTSNVTTNNVTTAKHGFAPILPNDSTKFLNGVGGYTVPPGTGTGTVSSVATTAPITGGTITTTGTIGISITTTNDGGAVVKQATSPGTQQTSANANVSGSILAGTSIGAGLTTAPLTAMDVNGLISVRRSATALSNGANNNVSLPSTGYMVITGPTGAFSITGVVPPSSADGAFLDIVNSTAQQMTIANASGSSSAANRINNLTGADLVLPTGTSAVRLVYDVTGGAWNVISSYPATAASSGGGGGNSINSTAAGSEPTGATGDLDLTTDSMVVERYSGGTWDNTFGPVWKFKDPNLQSWSPGWVNQGTATLSTDKRRLAITLPAGAGSNFRHYLKAVPSAPYTVTAYIVPSLYVGLAANSTVGICLRESSSGKFQAFGIVTANAGAANGYLWTASRWTNNTTFSANTADVGGNNNPSSTVYKSGPGWWMRVVDDNTNREFWVSMDKVTWMKLYTQTRTAFMTPDQIGICSDSQSASAWSTPTAGLWSWEE